MTHPSNPHGPTDALLPLSQIPEAQWVTDLRDHFAKHGFYRPADLERVVGKPGQSAGFDADGKVVLRG